MTTTLPLRELLRQPSKVKHLTRSGHVVRITDRGVPLWDVQPASGTGHAVDDARHTESVDALLEDLLAEAPLPTSARSVPVSEVVRRGRK